MRLSASILNITEKNTFAASCKKAEFDVKRIKCNIEYSEVERINCTALNLKELEVFKIIAMNGKKQIDAINDGLKSPFVIYNFKTIFELISIFIELYREKYKDYFVYDYDFVNKVIINNQYKINSIKELRMMTIEEIIDPDSFSEYRFSIRR